MNSNKLAIRVYVQELAQSQLVNVVISELSLAEVPKRVNAPKFSVLSHDTMDNFLEKISANEPFTFSNNTLVLHKGSSRRSGEDLQFMMGVNSILRTIVDMAREGMKKTKPCGNCDKCKCRVSFFEVYDVNPKDVEHYGTKVMRFSAEVPHDTAV